MWTKLIRCEGLVFVGVMLTLTTLAHAQPQSGTSTPAELAIRRQLIQQALQEDRAEQHQAALDHALQALRIQPSASLWLVVAQQQRVTGRFADALSSAEQCRTMVRDPTHLAQEREFVTAQCDQLIATLPARVGRVVLTVPTSAQRSCTSPLTGRSFHQPSTTCPTSSIQALRMWKHN